ncbi:MAG: histidine kinase [Bacteroidales bacterium]|nr:histidine kinase [Bacteroidales bacterium]
MKTKLINILTNPFFLALVISSVIIYFLPPVFDKYKVKLIEKSKNHGGSIIDYQDLDYDSFSEKILFVPNYPNKASVLVHTKNKIVDQWNFTGKLFYLIQHKFIDYDANNFKEVILFTYKNDSIFLNCFEPLAKNGIFVSDRFITTFKRVVGKKDFNIEIVGFSDLNNDGFLEIIFYITTGFSRQPRNLFAYDIYKDKLLISPKSCTHIKNCILYDIDNDGFTEILVDNNAFGNCSKEFPYSDQYSWLMVFNHELDFYFEPVKIGVYPSAVQILPFNVKDKIFFVVLYKNWGLSDKPSSLQLYDINGKLLNERVLDKNIPDEYTSLISINEKGIQKLFLMYSNGRVQQINNKLQTVKNKFIEGIYFGHPFTIDADNDGENEFLFWGKDKQNLIITRSNFSNPVKIKMPNNSLESYSIILRGNEKPQIFFQCDNYRYLFEYFKNPLYYFKYLIYIGIYASVLLFILMLNKIQKHRIEQKYETEKKIAELQMKSIKNQTDPHFTLNIINSIGSLYQKRDIKRANYVFGKYAKMLRYTLLSSDNILHTLSHELEYVENYLLLEKFRLDNKFDFNIDIKKDIDTDFKIPKMLIHTFVENAIKHGLKHLKSNGKLEIIINKNENKYVINIKDNGIGRKKAKELSVFSTGRGMKILDQIIELYYNLQNIKINYEITDLYDNFNNPKGTEVLIEVSL